MNNTQQHNIAQQHNTIINQAHQHATGTVKKKPAFGSIAGQNKFDEYSRAASCSKNIRVLSRSIF
jgi:hypothetical protein